MDKIQLSTNWDTGELIAQINQNGRVEVFHIKAMETTDTFIIVPDTRLYTDYRITQAYRQLQFYNVHQCLAYLEIMCKYSPTNINMSINTSVARRDVIMSQTAKLTGANSGIDPVTIEPLYFYYGNKFSGTEDIGYYYHKDLNTIFVARFVTLVDTDGDDSDSHWILDQKLTTEMNKMNDTNDVKLTEFLQFSSARIMIDWINSDMDRHNSDMCSGICSGMDRHNSGMDRPKDQSGDNHQSGQIRHLLTKFTNDNGDVVYYGENGYYLIKKSGEIDQYLAYLINNDEHIPLKFEDNVANATIDEIIDLIIQNKCVLVD